MVLCTTGFVQQTLMAWLPFVLQSHFKSPVVNKERIAPCIVSALVPFSIFILLIGDRKASRVTPETAQDGKRPFCTPETTKDCQGRSCIQINGERRKLKTTR